MADKTKVDKKTEITFNTLERLKSSGSTYNEFIRAAKQYQKQCQNMAEVGKQFAEALQKLGQLHTGDIGQGISKLAELQRIIETKQEQVGLSILNDLVVALEKQSKPDVNELQTFESEYKRVRNSVRSQISKLEGDTKKAGKSKNPEVLKQSIAVLNDKVKEAEQVKADKMRQILLIERKRFCFLLGILNSVMNYQVDYHNEGSKIKDLQRELSTLASSSQQLPSDIESLIKTQERTFVGLQVSQEDYSSSWNSSYDNSYQDYNTSSTGYDYSSYGNESYGLGTCTALYDFAGEQASDLGFYAGEVITIIQEDDGSGWIHGELNGARGIFPASYVQRN